MLDDEIPSDEGTYKLKAHKLLLLTEEKPVRFAGSTPGALAPRPLHSSSAMRNFPMGKLIRLLGSSAFPKALLEAVNDVASADHMAIVAFDHEISGHVMAAESMGKQQIAKAAGHIYEASFHFRHDPSARAIIGRRECDGEPLIFRLRACDIQNQRYRQQIYDNFGLIERITLIDRFDSHWYATSFYRAKTSGLFRADEVAGLEALADAVTALVGQHFALTPLSSWRREERPPVERLEEVVRRLNDHLTPRQIQVCARALVGMTNQTIGLKLGIRAPTVATLRTRAYAVLNITSLSELFALCLAQTIRHTD